MAHRSSAPALVVAIAICSTAAAAATDGVPAHRASPGDAGHRVQVLRIVEANHAAPSGTKILPKSKKLANRKVMRHTPVLARQPSSTALTSVAKSSDSPPLAAKQAGRADADPSAGAVAVNNEAPAMTRSAADERTSVAHPVHALMIKTQNAGPQAQGILPGAAPIASTDLRKTDDQVAARWPLDSELFTPLAPTYERASFQTSQ